MLHILLTILKVLGIVLAVILGLVLLILLLVLLVPIRYRLDGEFHKSKKAEATVTWLLRLLSIRGGYEDGIYYSVKVFGRTILSSSPKKKRKKKEKTPQEAVPDGTETILSEEASGSSGIPEETAGETVEPAETAGEPIVPVEAEAAASPAEVTAEEKPAELPAEVQPEDAGDTPGKKKKKKKEPRPKSDKPILERIEEFLDTLDERIEGISAKVEELAAKAEAGYEFIEDEENRKTFALILKGVLKLLKHIRPRSLKGYLELGLEDPYTMGQIMSAAAFFWPFYQENFRFTPVFDEKKLDGEVHMKGHLRLGYAALCALRLLLDRNFRKLLRMVLNR